MRSCVIMLLLIVLSSSASAQVPVPVPDDGPGKPDPCEVLWNEIKILDDGINRDTLARRSELVGMVIKRTETQNLHRQILKHIQQHNTFPDELLRQYYDALDELNLMTARANKLKQQIADAKVLREQKQKRYAEIGCK